MWSIRWNIFKIEISHGIFASLFCVLQLRAEYVIVLGSSVGASPGFSLGYKYGNFYIGVDSKVNIYVIWVLQFDTLKNLYTARSRFKFK